MHGWLHATVAVATHYSNILNSTLCARYKWSTRGSGMHRIPAANIACIAHRMHGTAGTAGSARAWRCLRCCTLRGYAGRGALRTRASAAARGRRPRGRGRPLADDDGAQPQERSPWQTLATSCAGPALLGADTLRGSAAAPAPPPSSRARPVLRLRFRFLRWLPACDCVGVPTCRGGRGIRGATIYSKAEDTNVDIHIRL
jgi:hypothetical protein